MSDLRTALAEAIDSHSDAPEGVIESKIPDAPGEYIEPKSRARDESGKFAKEPEPEVKAEVKKEEAPPAELKPEAPPRKAPSSWKPAAQEAWLKADRGEPLTPEEARLVAQEVERRESDFHKGVSEFKSHSERAKAYDAAIAPFQQHLQSIGIDAPTAISKLMKADVILRTADPATKSAYFARLAQEYGIDIGQAQQAPQLDPQTQFVMQQLQDLRQQQQMWQNHIQRQEQERSQAEMQAFASKPEHAHFEAVRSDMADLLESGKANSLEDAYEKAVWMRPDIRQSLIEQQRKDAEARAIEAAQAQRAKAAAVSVKGSSPAAGNIQAPKGSLREQLAASFAEHS